MNVDNYRRFLETIGHRVIASPSSHWSDVARWFYESIPPSRIITPDQSEINTLFRQHCVIGLKYCAPCDYVGKSSWIYICQDRDYDLKSLHRKMRNKVRQGLRNCNVRPVSFEYLRDHGIPLNQDTLKRQGRDDPMFSQMARWVRLCQAGQQTEGADAWGAFVGNQLAAYMITFAVEGYANILYQMSRTDLLDSRANNVLAFVATQEMLASPDIQCVSYGQASIRGLPGLEEYKVRLGYKKRPIRHVIVLHPFIRAIALSRIGDVLLAGLSQVFTDHDLVKLLNGTVDIARQSVRAGIPPKPDGGRLRSERKQGET
jgi:hypothetical protein